MLHAIIMAGGTGTRFWPASRNDTPKQLLRLVGDATMLRQTLDRLGELVPNERRMVVTNERLVEAVREQLPELPAAAVVGEPCKRDTAPCIGLAALLVSRDDPDATMVVMPADHVIRPAEKFQAAIRQAADTGRRVAGADCDVWDQADVSGGDLWVHPSRRATIRRAKSAAATFTVVKQFKEKPDAATAKKYVDSGEYYWNSGIFVWRAATILDALRKRQPEMLGHLETIVAAWDTERSRRRVRARVRGDQADFDRLRRDGARHRRRRDRSAVRVGRPGRLAIAGPAGRQRRKWQHDRRQALGARHQRHDRADRWRAPGRHARPEGLIVVHTPNATLVARQARRRANSPGGEAARRARLDGVLVNAADAMNSARQNLMPAVSWSSATGMNRRRILCRTVSRPRSAHAALRGAAPRRGELADGST